MRRTRRRQRRTQRRRQPFAAQHEQSLGRKHRWSVDHREGCRIRTALSVGAQCRYVTTAPLPLSFRVALVMLAVIAGLALAAVVAAAPVEAPAAAAAQQQALAQQQAPDQAPDQAPVVAKVVSTQTPPNLVPGLRRTAGA